MSDGNVKTPETHRCTPPKMHTAETGSSSIMWQSWTAPAGETDQGGEET